MTAISGGRVTDERVTCLRIFADANGETHMEDVDIILQPRKLFKDNPPMRLSDNLPASWCNICHVPSGKYKVDWRNPPQRLLVLWLTGEVEFETSDGDVRLWPSLDPTCHGALKNDDVRYWPKADICLHCRMSAFGG
jgi:hypothetical protein